MLLYVMRHGPAEDRASTGRDFDRALTPSGRELVRRMAESFREAYGSARSDMGLPSGSRSGAFPRILSSPRVRARETAEILNETLAGVPAPTGPVATYAAGRYIEVTPPAGMPIVWKNGPRPPGVDLPTIQIRNELDGEKEIPLELIAELAEAGQDALIVGHQPCVDELVRQLVEGGHDGDRPSSRPDALQPLGRRTPIPPVITSFRTAMIVGLEGGRAIAPNPRRWRLAIVLDPRRIAP